MISIIGEPLQNLHVPKFPNIETTTFPETRLITTTIVLRLITKKILFTLCSIFNAKENFRCFFQKTIFVKPSMSELMLITSVFLYSQVEAVQWTFDNIDSESGDLHHLAKFLSDKNIDMVINLPMRGSGARR